ncbi:MAG: hypothetical protein A2Y36_00155 [Treponema sp. GWA1_62_8]|nr:MAG: hypothetical protein A2Y36_00155 [Treponema sp. GWA1_62_8]
MWPTARISNPRRVRFRKNETKTTAAIAKMKETGKPPRKPSVPSAGRGIVIGCPSAGSLKGLAVATKLRKCWATKLSMMVEMMGLMSQRDLRPPAAMPKRPPEAVPMTMSRGMRIHAGSPRGASVRPAAAAAVPPIIICPQPPILKNLIMKGMEKA